MVGAAQIVGADRAGYGVALIDDQERRAVGADLLGLALVVFDLATVAPGCAGLAALSEVGAEYRGPPEHGRLRRERRPQRGEFIDPPDGPPGAVRADLMFSTSETGDLIVQLRNTLTQPLRKKFSNQLRRAKDLGYPTMLALDQLGHEGLPGGTDWLPSTNAVTTVAAEVCDLHPGVLDAAVLATPKDTITQIFGNRLRAS